MAVATLEERFEFLDEDERKLLLLALKLLGHNISYSRGMGYPVTIAEVKAMVTKLGGKAELL